MRKRHDPELISRIGALRRAGLLPHEIASALRVGREEVVHALKGVRITPEGGCPAKTHREATPRGERCKQTPLKAPDVRLIRAMVASGVANGAELGRAYGVSKNAISAIVRRKSWTHI